MRFVRSPDFALRLYFFVGFGAVGIYLPHFPSWVAGHGFVGASMSALMLLLPLMSLLAPPLLGVLADRFSLRGKLITLCSAVSAFGLTLLGLLAWAFDPLPFWPTLGAMWLFALLRSPSLGLADVVAMETASNYGRMRLWGSLGFLTAALFGSRVVGPEHPFALPLAVAACGWLQTLASLGLPRSSKLPPTPALADARRLLQQVGYRRLLLTIGVIFSSLTAYDLCVSMRVRALGASDTYVGQFWALATIAEAALMFWLAPILRRVGSRKLLTLSCVVAAGRWVAIAEVSDLGLLLLLQPLHAISFGMMWLSAVAVLKCEAGQAGTATAQGLFAACVAVGGTIGTATWGVLYDAYGARVVFYSAALLSLVAALAATRLMLLKPQPSPPSHP
ncbi:MAG: hypothetical protein RJA70_3821 [Pseudomonadota bacterium]